MNKNTAKELIKFIDSVPSTFHVAAKMEKILSENGFSKLSENEKWNIEKGKSYFVTRNSSSIIAFRIPQGDFKGYQIMSSHSDSPSFKIKTNPEIEVEGHYIKLNVEKYGGLICSPWFDRPLSVAGRILIKENGKVKERLVDVDKDLLMIPNLAVHMNRSVNEGYTYNIQKDMLPLMSCEGKKGKFMKLVAKSAKVDESSILSMDLFCYNRDKGRIWGQDNEFVSSAKLDDLECAFASLKGILAGGNSENVAVHCVFDNEEVGSGTKQGAAADFLRSVLVKINASFGKDESDYLTALANSFMVSADNAHAVHPNYADMTDPTNRPYINCGIVIKHSANQKYTTDAVSDAVFKTICEKAEIPTQSFLNRSDMQGGSTLGNISTSQVSLKTVDIGLPQLAMHSSYETAGTIDVDYLVRAATEFFNSTIIFNNNDFEVR